MRPRENATTGSIVVANCLFVIILSRFASCGIVLSAFVRSPFGPAAQCRLCRRPLALVRCCAAKEACMRLKTT